MPAYEQVFSFIERNFKHHHDSKTYYGPYRRRIPVVVRLRLGNYLLDNDVEHHACPEGERIGKNGLDVEHRSSAKNGDKWLNNSGQLSILPVLAKYLKISRRMRAGRALLGGFLARVQVTAV